MREWNAESYHRVSEPQFVWGQKVLAELELEGDETVIDAGCGSGRLTALLAERLPRGRVIALDASSSMLDVARRELARFGDQVVFVQADLASLELGAHARADVVFSTATFHWVLDHQALFDGLHAVLKPGGRLHAQCGGFGNLQHFLALAMGVARSGRWAKFFDGFVYPTFFATAEDTLARLKAARFEAARAWLTPAPTDFPDSDSFQQFIGTVVLRNVVARLPGELAPSFLDAVTRAAGQQRPPNHLDYVRLDLRATAAA